MSKPSKQSLLDKITSACKRRGFIFPSSEIYGGINGFWDFGPAGAQLKRNVRDLWWNTLVGNGHTGPDNEKFDIVGLDASIIMNNRVWEASGHTTSFSDPMVDCRKCKQRFRADMLPETKCTEGGEHDYTDVRDFNLMFKTHVGPVQDDDSTAYLRPETAQAIFVQFQNILTVSRTKVPFGIAQMGKAFRNEINPRNYIFRSREFEQMELEFFVKPGTEDAWLHWWLNKRMEWYVALGITPENLSIEWHPQDKLAHYAKACADIMYAFPFGIQELEGIASRTDFDLKAHAESSGKIPPYFDAETNQKYYPYVVEPSAGLDRTVLAILCDAYCEESLTNAKGQTETRTVFRFHPKVAPVTVAVFPLLRNRPELIEKAEQVFGDLRPHFRVQWDDRGNIGKRYRYQDELGTPYCVTIDFDTIGAGETPENTNTVTVRDRDTMEQVRIPVPDVTAYLKQCMNM
jgi:glycyl-tRNA synthetase